MSKFSMQFYTAFAMIFGLLCLVLAGVLVSLGLDYIRIGYGLSPWLAFPFATLVAIGAPVIWLVLWDQAQANESHESPSPARSQAFRMPWLPNPHLSPYEGSEGRLSRSRPMP